MLKHMDKGAVHVLMMKLFQAQRYNSIVKVFFGYLDAYTARESEPNPLPTDQRRIIPNSHLEIVTRSLLEIV